MPSGFEELDLKVYLDYSQERQNNKNPFVFATDGTQISSATLNNCIIDPCTLSVFGKPLPMTDEWKREFSGPYARFSKNDFGWSDPTKILVNGYYAPEDYYFFAGTGATAFIQEKVPLNTYRDRNEAIFISYKKLSKQTVSGEPIISLYWENAFDDNIDTDTRLDFNNDGSCDVFRGYKILTGTIITSTLSATVTGFQTKFSTELLAGQKLFNELGFLIGVITSITNDFSLTLTGLANIDYAGVYTSKTWQKVQRYSRTESNFSQERPITTVNNPNDVYNDIYIIPTRGKELLVLTSFGLNFSHSFGDLNVPDPPGDATYYYNSGNKTIVPIILPRSLFSFQARGAKVAWQAANLNFLANWNAFSNVTFTPAAPPAWPTPRDGSIFFVKGGTGITGNNTAFTSNLAVNDLLVTLDNETFQNSTIIGIVTNIASGTAISVASPITFTGLGTSYSAHEPKTGLTTFAIGSTAVTGAGTLFTTEISANDYLYNVNGSFIGIASTINSNTSLYLQNVPYFSGSGVTVYKNLNPYKFSDFNLQGEFFGSIASTYPLEDITLLGDIKFIDGQYPPFNGERTAFQIEISQVSTGASIQNQGFMFYSYDHQFYTANNNTTESTVDITSKLQTFSLGRTENGDLTCSFAARKDFLSELGVVKPDIISNRSLKVELKPRQILLSGQLTFDTTTVVTGVSTAFLSEIQPGDYLWKSDGTFAGIVTGVPSDTILNLFQNKIPGIEYNQTCSLDPNFSQVKIFEGYTGSPQITYVEGENYDKYSILEFSANDKKQRLNRAYASVAPNYDNKPLADILLNAIYLGGEADNNTNHKFLEIDNSITTYQIPINRNNSQGQYNFILNLGDTAGGFIEQIRTDYAQNFTFFARGDWSFRQQTQDGYDNFTQFKFHDLDLIPPGAKKLDLYLNENEADSVGEIPIYQSYKRTIRSLRKVYEAPEANRIIVVGLDKTDGNRIEKILDNLSSQNPSTPPNQREDTWLGDVLPFVYINQRLNTTTDVNQAALQFYNRISTGREIVEFESDLLTYFDKETRSTATNVAPLLGTVAVTSGSTTVNGGGTYFTADLQVGDEIYSSINGDWIGVVAVITSDTVLELLFEPTITFNGGYNKATYYIDQYNYIDIGDVVRVYYLDLTYDDFQVIDWSCQSQREINNGTQYDINVRTASYRAKKVTVPASSRPYIAFNFANIPAVNQIIVTYDTNLKIPLYAVDTPYEEAGFAWSLSNAPAGMTIDGTTGEVDWTPTVGQANAVYEDIVASVMNESGVSAEYTFSVRVYNQDT